MIFAFAFNISRLIFGGNDPALWNCPIQVGLPYLLFLAEIGLMFVASLAFIFGLLSAVFNYLTAYGNEDKIKTANQTLRWTLIGAVVVMLSYFLIINIVNFVLAPGEKVPLVIFPTVKDQCKAQQSADQFNQELIDIQKEREANEKAAGGQLPVTAGGTGGIKFNP